MYEFFISSLDNTTEFLKQYPVKIYDLVFVVKNVYMNKER